VRVDIMGDATFDLQGRRVCVAGHSGMLGSALVRRLVEEDCRLLPLGREILDLRDQAAVFAWFDEYRPDVVFLAAATVGGIYANDRQPFPNSSQKGAATGEFTRMTMGTPAIIGAPVRAATIRVTAVCSGL
jgi:hypothetical protein